MTNDGNFTQKLQHPRFRISKTYEVKINGHLRDHDLQSLLQGIQLEDGKFKPDHIQVIKKSPRSTWLTLTISEGRNRLIRRGFEALGRSVVRLLRVSVADLHLGNLKTGTYRHLTREEVKKLLSFSK
jgi:pseudouridine synthase